MRRWAMIALLGIGTAGCGIDATTSAPTTVIVEPTTLQTTDAPAPSDDVEPAPLDPLEAPDDLVSPPDRSILSLALEPGETEPGRFRLLRGGNTETLMTVDGRYWMAAEGNVYTSFDIDPDLVAAQMQLLIEIVEEAGGQAPGSPYLASLRNHYRGDQFQIGLAGLARSLGMGGLPTEWAEQWGWFAQASGNPIPAELIACQEATAALDAGARDWVTDLDIEVTDGRWVFPVEAFYAALEPQVDAASICETLIEPGPIPDIVIEVSDRATGPWIDVLVDDNLYTDRDPTSAFSIMMSTDESVGAAPKDPRPASLFTLQNSYLASIGVCGELPWIYSNFAAANSYESPQSGGYSGPVVFASGWYCEDEVPEEWRREGN